MKQQLHNIKDNIVVLLRESETLRGLPFWTAALVAGLVAVLYAKFFLWAEHLFFITFEKWPESIFILTPSCFLLSWYLVYKFSPNASGSGIPQTLAAIDLAQIETSEKKIIRSFFSLKIAIIKIFSCVLAVLGGGVVGREGPTIQVSAYIFYAIGDKFKSIWTYRNLDIWFVTGGAAGIAAAFNTPLGGIVYAIEELSSSHFNRFKTSLITGVIISGFIAQTLAGGYLYIGVPHIVRFTPQILPYAFFIGAVAGLAGAIFGNILFYIVQRRKQIHDIKMLFLVSIGIGLLVASLIYFTGPMVGGSGRDMITNILFDGKKSTLSIVIARYISAILAYANGGAGGIFAPSLGMGASIGAFISEFLHMSNQNLFTMLGMVAFLTGVTRAPFTSFVLVLEMTDRHSVIMPVMIAAVSAQIFARFAGKHSFYEQAKFLYMDSFKLTRHAHIEEERI